MIRTVAKPQWYHSDKIMVCKQFTQSNARNSYNIQTTDKLLYDVPRLPYCYSCADHEFHILKSQDFFVNLMSSTVSVALPSLEGVSTESVMGKVASLQMIKIYPNSIFKNIFTNKYIVHHSIISI